MRYSEIYTSSAVNETALDEKSKEKVPEYGTEAYGTWEIKFRNIPKNGKFDAMGMHKRNTNIPRASAASVEDAIADVKKQIDRYVANDDSVLKYAKGQINLNAEFTRECLEHGPTGVRLSRVGDESILTVCSPEYAELGPEVYGSGEGQFTKLFQRKPATSDENGGGAATLYLAGITTNKIRQLGLQPNGRYSLQYVGKDPEYGHLVYKLIFDSITAGPADKQRLHTPGLTLAVS